MHIPLKISQLSGSRRALLRGHNKFATLHYCSIEFARGKDSSIPLRLPGGPGWIPKCQFYSVGDAFAVFPTDVASLFRSMMIPSRGVERNNAYRGQLHAAVLSLLSNPTGPRSHPQKVQARSYFHSHGFTLPTFCVLLIPARASGTLRTPCVPWRHVVGHEQDRSLRSPGVPAAGEHPPLPFFCNGDPQIPTIDLKPCPRTSMLPATPRTQPPGFSACV